MHSGVRVPLLRLATFAALSALAGVCQAQGAGATVPAASSSGSPPASSTRGQSASDQTAASVAALQRELDEQAKKLAELEKEIAAQEKEVQHPAQPASVGVVNANRFSIASADGQNVLRFGGLVEGQGRYFTDSCAPPSDNTFLLRRVRPIMEGTLYGMFDFRVMPDFDGSKTVLDDAYVAARFSPAAAITFGKFKAPVGLEMLQSPAELRFIERGLPSDLVPNRDVGAQLGGDVSKGVFGYAVGYFNGVTDGASSDSDPAPNLSSVGRKDLAARIFVQPFLRVRGSALQGLGFGIGGTYADFSGTPGTPLLPSYKTVGQETFFNYRASTAATSTSAATGGTYAKGERLRWTPQLYYAVHNVALLAEYVHVSQGVARVNGTLTRSALLVNTGWQTQVSWFITGEQESYRGFTPHTAFQLGGPGWGAFELVARVGELSVDPAAFADGANSFANPATSARRAQDAGVGVNWYLNANVKWSLGYDRTQFKGGAPDGADRPDEEALFMQILLSF